MIPNVMLFKIEIMNFTNLKKASDYDVQDWLERSIRDLSKSQKHWIREEGIVRTSPYYFMENRSKTDNVITRLSVIFIIPVIILLIIGLPFNYFFTGRWGYNPDRMKWYSKWSNACGL